MIFFASFDRIFTQKNNSREISDLLLTSDFEHLTEDEVDLMCLDELLVHTFKILPEAEVGSFFEQFDLKTYLFKTLDHFDLVHSD